MEQPLSKKAANWARLGSEWKLDDLEFMAEEIGLEEVPEYIDRMARGQVVGRYLVNINR